MSSIYFRFKTAKLKLFSSLILTARLTVTNVINVNTIEFAPIGESTGAIPQVNILNTDKVGIERIFRVQRTQKRHFKGTRSILARMELVRQI